MIVIIIISNSYDISVKTKWSHFPVAAQIEALFGDIFLLLISCYATDAYIYVQLLIWDRKK